MNRIRRLGVGCMLMGSLAIMALAMSSSAQEPVKKEKAVKQTEREPVDWTEKKYSFELSGKAWPDIFRWLADESGLPYSSPYKPAGGGLNVITPKGAKYSLLEVYDIINERLQHTEKFTLLRTDISLTLVPGDVDIPTNLVPQIDPKELKNRGRTEIVLVIVKLKPTLNADEFAPEVKRMVGNFGHVTPLVVSNQLMIRADVATLLRVLPIITSQGEDVNEHTHSYKCLYIRAATAAEVLRTALGQSRTVVERVKSGAPPGPEGDGKGGPFRPQTPQVSRTVREHVITFEKLSNTVIITGPSNKIDEAKTILKSLDVKRDEKDKGLLPTGPLMFMYHDLPGGSADVMAKVLEGIYKSDDGIKISVATPSRLFVFADPQTHSEINKIVNLPPASVSETVSIALSRLDATKLAETIKIMLPNTKQNSPFVEADTDHNAIRIRGTKDEINDVKIIIQVLDGDPFGTGRGNVRMINLEKASGATAAEALFQILPKFRPDNDIQLKLPSQTDDNFKSLDFKLPEKKADPKPVEKKPMARAITPESLREKIYLTGKPASVGYTTQEEKKAEPKKKTPVIITGFGNRIIITSEDKEALDTAQQLLRMLVNVDAGPGDIEVIRLQVANAVEVAKILDEAFNGPKQGGQGGGGGRQGGGGGGLNIPGVPGFVSGMLGIGGGGQQNARTENIRVVADSATNSLLIKAKPIDMLTIRRLLDRYIDVRDPNSEVIVKTHHIQLKNAKVNEVADIVRTVFSESMKAATQNQAQGGGGQFGMFGPRPVDASGIDKKVLLTVAPETHTNTLYVACPTTLFREIETLVKNMDMAAADTKEVVRIVSIDGIPPDVLQAALDAFSGKSQQQKNQANQLPGGLGAGGFGPGGTGGFGQGRFGAGGFQGGAFPGGGGGTVMPMFINPGGGSGTPTPTPGGGIRTPGGGKGGGKGGGVSYLERGSDFFVLRVMDDPLADRFFDPSEAQQEPPLDRDHLKAPAFTVNPLEFTAQMQPKMPGAAQATMVTMTDAKGNWPGTYTITGSTITMDFPRVAKYTGTISVGYKMSGVASDDRFQWNWTVERKPGSQNDWIGTETRPGYGQLAFHFGPTGGPSGDLEPPRQDFEANVLPDLNILVLRGRSEADIRAIMQIIELIRRESQPAAIDIELVPVRYGDPVEIANILNTLYTRVQLTQGSLKIVPPTTTGAATAQPTPGASGAPTVVPVATAQASNMILLPQPKLAAILVAITKGRMADIKAKIRMFDQPPSDPYHAVYFPLRRASAVRVAASLNTFFATRPSAPLNVNQMRITWDDGSNTIIVQASPADLTEIARLIDYIDSRDFMPKNEMRVVPLRQAVATDLATLLQLSIANGVLTINPSTTGAPGGGGVPPGGGGVPGGVGQTGFITKDSRLSFIPSNFKGGKPFETKILEDIRVNADIRTNSLVVSAPEESMQLLLALIRDLDVPPTARSEINIFHLKKSDATQLALMLQQLFLGTGVTGRAGTPAAPAPAITGPAGAAGQRPPPSFVISPSADPSSPIIDLRVTVDERTNSLIVAGARSDLIVVESIIGKIEDAEVQERRSEAIRLRNTQAVDLVNALTPFYTNSNAVFTKFNQGTNSLEIQREVVLAADPITNSVLINATPRYFAEIVNLISKLDTPAPQVVISVLIAEVLHNGAEDFGMELGLQNPISFARGFIPGAGTAPVYSTGAVGIPGFFFNNPPSNATADTRTPGLLGLASTTNLGVQRVSSVGNVPGYTFSANADVVSVLIRALKVQGRIDVLSTPQITTLDNQTGFIQDVVTVPIATGGGVVTVTGQVSAPGIGSYDTGITLQVTPRITPDGRVLMRVIPEVSAVDRTDFPLGNGTFSTSFKKQHLETTVLAADGETIILGGLISKRDTKIENKVPWLGDLPGIGTAFRYRSFKSDKKELIIIMTPRIVRNRFEAERVLDDQIRRMPWNVNDVIRVYGNGTGAACAPGLMPEPQSKTQPYRVYPGTPEGRPQVTPLEYSVPVEMAPSKAPLGRGGMFRSIFEKPAPVVIMDAPPPGVRDGGPMIQPMPTFIRDSRPTPTPLPDVIVSPEIVLPPVRELGPALPGR